jgi:hypothetical protein
MEPGLDRALGDADDIGDLRMRQPDVVMQDNDDAMLRRQAFERPIERIAVVDGDRGIRDARSVDRQLADVDAPASIAP